jgi:hypothetical protein
MGWRDPAGRIKTKPAELAPGRAPFAHRSAAHAELGRAFAFLAVRQAQLPRPSALVHAHIVRRSEMEAMGATGSAS